jgi:hypothetical protein
MRGASLGVREHLALQEREPLGGNHTQKPYN